MGVSEHQAPVGLADCDPAAVVGRRSPAGTAPGYVALVGIGRGGPLRLTLAALKTIGEADVIVVGADLGDGLLGEPEVSVADQAQILLADADPDLTKVAELVRGGLMVAWLLPGDPLIDGAGGPLAVALGELGCRIDVIPGLSLASLALTAVGVRPQSSGWTLLGDPATDDEPGVLQALVRPDQVAAVAERAQAAGHHPETPVLVTVNSATTRQQTIETVLGALVKTAAKLDAVELSVLVGAAARREASLNWFESKPLFGWQVLVPRTKGLSGAMERRLEHHGAIPVQVPTISVEPPRNPQPMERAIQGLVDGRYQWIIFNSANAVRAVTERLSLLGLDSRAFSGLRIAAIGALTVQALQSWGITPDLVPEGKQRGEALAAEFPVFDDLLDPINRILIPRADIAVDALAASMNELGWEVEDVIAYRTVRAAPPPAEIRDSIKGGRFDAVVFSSASTVRNMVGIAGKPHVETIVAAIGPATVASCTEHGLRVDVVAEYPGHAELVDALAEFAQARREAQIARGEPPNPPSRRPTRRRR